MFQCIIQHRHCELMKYQNIRFFGIFGMSNADVSFGVTLSKYPISVRFFDIPTHDYTSLIETVMLEQALRNVLLVLEDQGLVLVS